MTDKMTDKECIQEQEYLRQKFYYDPEYGDKLVRFYLEMTQDGVWSIETIAADKKDELPF